MGRWKTRDISLPLLNESVDFAELAEHLGEFGERNLIGTVGERFGGLGMSFHEHAITTRGDGSPCEDGGKLAISAGGGAEATRTLHGVGGIKDDAETELTHPVEGTHVGDEILVTKGGAALGEEEVLATNGLEFFSNVFDIPGGHERAFFYINGTSSLASREDEVGLAGEEGGNLEEIDVFSGDFCLLRGVDVGGDWDAELLADTLEELAARFDADAAIRTTSAAVGFVVGGFEDPLQTQAVSEGPQTVGHVPDEFFTLDDTGSEDE